jgi:hypothetical protein
MLAPVQTLVALLLRLATLAAPPTFGAAALMPVSVTFNLEDPMF